MAASRPGAPAPAASGREGSKRGDRTVPRRDSGGQHRRAALLPRIDTDRERTAQERRRGRAHQRSRTTSHAGLTFARAPGRTSGAPIVVEVAGTRGENATAAERISLRAGPHGCGRWRGGPDGARGAIEPGAALVRRIRLADRS